MEQIIVTVNGKKRAYRPGITLLEISRDFAGETKYDIMLAIKDGKLRELNKSVREDCTVQFLTVADNDGRRTYRRGMILLMLRAFEQEFGEDRKLKIKVEYALGNGLYCECEEPGLITAERIERVKQRMAKLVEEDIPFHKKTISTADAVELFHNSEMYDKEKLFRFRRVSKTNIYNFDGYEDYFYGYMPPSSGMLKHFDLIFYEQGFVLTCPERVTPDRLQPFVPTKHLFDTLQVSNHWGKRMGIETVGDLNEEITKGRMNELILIQEALIEKKIAEIAEQIQEAGGKKFIMIAGPSSSGKTTFSHRLSIQLKTLGLKPHPIGVDDYFVNREDTPRDENGELNFETLAAIDVKQFNQDMTDLLNGKRVELPSFNFKTGKREYKGNYKQLGPDDILVIEGIHCLNDALSYSLPKESKFKIYISALTQLNIDEHNRIPTTDGRLIRRMVRDARTRGTSAKNTIAMWGSVRRGEEENIFPYQECADVMFNSAMIYELPVLKQYAEPILFGIDTDCPEYTEAKRLLKFLDYFLGVSSENVPKNSLMREFIGGSVFQV